MDDLTKQYSPVMELCDKTLFDYLADIAQRREISIFPIKQKLLLLRDISRAMVFLHGRSILHFDLHASNETAIREDIYCKSDVLVISKDFWGHKLLFTESSDFNFVTSV